MSTLGKIVYLSEAQASELFANGSITVDGTTITYSADDLYLTPENIEYVKKSGDTMTGGLNMTVARIYNASYPSLAFRATENGSNIASIGVGTNDNTMAFIQKSPDTSHYENYYLPNPASGLTSDKYYNIVTTNGSYTMTGALAAKTLQTYNRGDNYASLSFKNTTTGSDNAAMNCYLSNNRVFITEYSPGTTYVERFYLPAPDSSRTASADYNILTTKSPVTVAQGGTGDTGIVSGTLENVNANVTIQSETRLRRWGRVVNFSFHITLSASLAAYTPLFYFPTGFRSSDVYNTFLRSAASDTDAAIYKTYTYSSGAYICRAALPAGSYLGELTMLI